MRKMADNVRKTINTNLDVVKGSTSTYFTGVDDLISNSRLDPLVTGYGFVRLVDVPSWFQEDPDLKHFSSMINKNTRAFSGLSDIELTNATHQSGFAGNEFNVVTGITRGNTEFTLTHKEYRGSPMTKLYRKYINYIRDSRTGLAMYPSVFNVEYGSRMHSCSFIIFTTSPDLLNKNADTGAVIEHAVFYSNAVPSNIPQDAYNWTHGEQDSPEITVNWSGMPEFGPDVDELALRILRDEILNVTEDGDGIPYIDSFGYHKNAVSLQKTGWLKDIYNPERD